jgi:hypothetical protein
LKSSLKRPWPVISRSSSMRGIGFPTARKFVASSFMVDWAVSVIGQARSLFLRDAFSNSA